MRAEPNTLIGRMRAAPPLAPTPGQILGPYYPVAPDPAADADLTRWPGAERRAEGARLEVDGRVRDQRGRAVAGALIEC
ncbi:MAG: intradiol ring-cleavage dioxygenase, partial [Pseudomonadota bacterium]